jgi:hypothetical protein
MQQRMHADAAAINPEAQVVAGQCIRIKQIGKRQLIIMPAKLMRSHLGRENEAFGGGDRYSGGNSSRKANIIQSKETFSLGIIYSTVYVYRFAILIYTPPFYNSDLQR